MVGVPFLVTRWLCGPSSRIGWPLPCRTRSAAMIVGPEQEDEDERRDRRAAGAEGDVAEDVEDRDLVGEAGRGGRASGDFLSLPVFGGRPAGAKRAFRLSTSGPIRLAFDPLTMTTSPAPIASASSGSSSAAVSA